MTTEKLICLVKVDYWNIPDYFRSEKRSKEEKKNLEQNQQFFDKWVKQINSCLMNSQYKYICYLFIH